MKLLELKYKNKFLGAVSSAIKTNLCFDPVIQTGDKVGSDDPATNMDPAYTSTGTLIYSFQADTSTGDIILKLGDDGTTKEDNVFIISIKHNGTEIGLQWDDTGKYYIGNDIDIANDWAAEVGNKLCIGIFAIPDLLQWFTFETIEVKGVTDIIVHNYGSFYTYR